MAVVDPSIKRTRRFTTINVIITAKTAIIPYFIPFFLSVKKGRRKIIRKNSVNHPPGTIEPLIGGIIPSPNIGNIFLNSKSGPSRMIKRRSGKIKTGTNNWAALPIASIPPRTTKAQRSTIDAMITTNRGFDQKRVDNKFSVTS